MLIKEFWNQVCFVIFHIHCTWKGLAHSLVRCNPVIWNKSLPGTKMRMVVIEYPVNPQVSSPISQTPVSKPWWKKTRNRSNYMSVRPGVIYDWKSGVQEVLNNAPGSFRVYRGSQNVHMVLLCFVLLCFNYWIMKVFYVHAYSSVLLHRRWDKLMIEICGHNYDKVLIYTRPTFLGRFR